MGTKKGKHTAKASKSDKRPPEKRTEQPQESPVEVDPRAMERMTANISKLVREQNVQSEDELREFLSRLLDSGEIPSFQPATPLDQAQELIYDALETGNPRKRAKLARKALEISPDCADAYVLLAEETAKDLREAKELYEQGVKAGERALGPEAFKEDVGHFWGLMETRPYMRARCGLAETLWMLGERRQAVEHFSDMLRLNPNDNQGIRYRLAALLVELGENEALGKLLTQYKGDGTADWLYTRALWLFRTEGASAKAHKALRKAVDANPFVPEFLLSKRPLPDELPDFMGFGDENEAIAYAAHMTLAWRYIPGALEWLAEQVA